MGNLLSKTVTAVAILSVAPIFAAEVTVNWDEPEKFTDVKPSNESRQKFRERTLRSLEEYFVDLAAALPAQQKLTVTVTDLDLAGEVWPASFVGMGNSGSDVRLVKRHYIPRMAFNYSLSDESGTVVKQAEVNLKDMGFMDGLRSNLNHESLRYEKQMLKEWFEDEFGQQVSVTL